MNKAWFIVILIFLFIGCSDDNINENKQPNNPLVGTWSSYDNTGLLVIRKVYTEDQYTYFTIIDGSEVKNIDPQHYKVYGNQLIFNRYTQTYKIESDTLWITNSTGDQTTKYIRLEVDIK